MSKRAVRRTRSHASKMASSILRAGEAALSPPELDHCFDCIHWFGRGCKKKGEIVRDVYTNEIESCPHDQVPISLNASEREFYVNGLGEQILRQKKRKEDML